MLIFGTATDTDMRKGLVSRLSIIPLYDQFKTLFLPFLIDTTITKVEPEAFSIDLVVFNFYLFWPLLNLVVLRHYKFSINYIFVDNLSCVSSCDLTV